MRWEKLETSVQNSTCGRYVVVKANAHDWVAYDISLSTAAKELGTRDSDLKCRGLCEAHESMLRAAHRRPPPVAEVGDGRHE